MFNPIKNVISVLKTSKNRSKSRFSYRYKRCPIIEGELLTLLRLWLILIYQIALIVWKQVVYPITQNDSVGHSSSTFHNLILLYRKASPPRELIKFTNTFAFVPNRVRLGPFVRSIFSNFTLAFEVALYMHFQAFGLVLGTIADRTIRRLLDWFCYNSQSVAALIYT